MHQKLAEILLFAAVAMNAALLTFMAGVLRKVMNGMKAAEYKGFLGSLYHHSERSPFMLTVLNIPFVAAIPYLYYYGFRNRWIVAGLSLWLAAGLIAKSIKLPVLKRIAALDSHEAEKLSRERTKINAGNVLQAILSNGAAALMIGAFLSS